jgi:hypothetical protein
MMASASKINEAISILLAAYPSAGQKATMGPFLALVTKTLEPYANEVLRELVDPRTGIITESEFFPSIAKLKEFCDARHKRLLEESFRARAEEDRRNALPPPPVDPQIQARVASGLRELSRELGAPKSSEFLTVEDERAKAERWLQQQAELAKTQPPIEISESLRAILFKGESRAD